MRVVQNPSPPRIVRDKAFAKRLEQACENNAYCPTDMSRGKQKWLYDHLESDFGIKVSPEAVRKWFYGESRPRPMVMKAMAVLLINRLRGIGAHSEWVFPSPQHRSTKPISENAMIYALYRMGWAGRSTVHGFRSAASTVLNEREFNRDWVEMQLAHVDGSVRGIYNAARYLSQRRTMMQWWSDFIEPQDTVFGDL